MLSGVPTSLRRLEIIIRDIGGFSDFASADAIARAVVYAVSQPQDVSVSEIVVGPRKSFPHVG
jgi:hypothetical protein